MTPEQEAMLRYLLNDEIRSGHVLAAALKLLDGVMPVLQYEIQAGIRRQAMIEAELQGRSPADGHGES